MSLRQHTSSVHTRAHNLLGLSCRTISRDGVPHNTRWKVTITAKWLNWQQNALMRPATSGLSRQTEGRLHHRKSALTTRIHFIWNQPQRLSVKTGLIHHISQEIFTTDHQNSSQTQFSKNRAENKRRWPSLTLQRLIWTLLYSFGTIIK